MLRQLIGTVEKATNDVFRVATQAKAPAPAAANTASADASNSSPNSKTKKRSRSKASGNDDHEEHNDDISGTAATSIGARAKRRRRKSQGSPDGGGHGGHVSRGGNVVHHDYHDWGCSSSPEPDQLLQPVEEACGGGDNKRGRGGISSPFPTVLHIMLEHAERDGYSDVVSWQVCLCMYCIQMQILGHRSNRCV